MKANAEYHDHWPHALGGRVSVTAPLPPAATPGEFDKRDEI